MEVENRLMEKAEAILRERGCPAVDLAKSTVLKDQKYVPAPLRDALLYFIKEWNDVLHPALVSLACEGVGGKPEATTKMGAALVLLAGGADIHDDIIDGSELKGSEQTIFGKFGKDLAVLAGDALLLEGIYTLHEACENLEMTKKELILDLVKRAFFEISGAEAAEIRLRGRIDIPKQQYLDIIRHKVAAGEAAARIGALIGDGTQEEVETLAEYARVYGLMLSIRDDFIDVFEHDELSNRVRREVLPLPIIVTLSNKLKKPSLMKLLKGKITQGDIEEIVDLAMDSEESALLVSEMKRMVYQITMKIQNLRYCKENLEFIAKAALEDL